MDEKARARWRLVVILAILLGIAGGAALGVGGFTFIYARGGSYMTDDPKACANCHVMREQYEGWLRSSHHAVAVCNDCHTPTGFIPKYITKAENGYHHSLAFTTGDFHEPIRMKARNRAITENACRKCHENVVEAVNGPPPGSGPGGVSFGAPHQNMQKLSCIQCHGSVGHR
ncbi:MAG: cytochrome c nitrite reductase small subunit [Armatimonadetes bacterium]|nr:cytochrome c nitrite reductase small subunit [Armatimonadota bacterium]